VLCWTEHFHSFLYEQLILYVGTAAICSEIHTKYVNTVCGQNVQFFIAKPSGSYSKDWALKGYAMGVLRR